MNPQPKTTREIDEHFLEWIKTFPCFVQGILDQCSGPLDPDHSTPRSLGGSDRTALPLCRHHHQLANRRTWFQKTYRIVFKNEVEKYNRLYERQFPNRVKRERKTVRRPFRKLLRVWCACNREGIGFPIFEDKAGVEQYQRDVERLKFIRCTIEPESWRKRD